MAHAPSGPARPVVGPGEFVFAAAFADHGHLFGQCNGLIEAGGTLRWVFDPEPARLASLVERYPQARAARSLEEILDDDDVRLVAAAAVPSRRGPLGCRVLRAGKDYFTDKAPFTTLDQLDDARRAVAETGRKYMVYYGERLHSECATRAAELVAEGAIGRVVQVLGLGPHRLTPEKRPDWFFRRETAGGILCDIGSHQVEQFLYYTGASDARVAHSAVANFAHPEYPEFEDFGEMSLVADNGASGYHRVDWFTPSGLRVWGDGRTFLLGTEGYIEMRKYLDVAREETGDHLYLVDSRGEQHLSLSGCAGYPFFGRLILDCLCRTEDAMTQEHAFKAAEIALRAQAAAVRLDRPAPA